MGTKITDLNRYSQMDLINFIFTFLLNFKFVGKKRLCFDCNNIAKKLTLKSFEKSKN